MVEELRSAILNLKQNPPNVLKSLSSLANCHLTFLEENNDDGFFWSSSFLEYVMNAAAPQFPATPEGMNKLFDFLVGTLQAHDHRVRQEDCEALAAYTVGCQVLHSLKTYELAVEWFVKSHGLARTAFLKHEVCCSLGGAFTNLRRDEEAFDWFRLAAGIRHCLVAIYYLGYLSAELRDFDSAQTFSAMLRNDSTNFGSAFAAMLDVEIKVSQGPSTEPHELLLAYSKARRLLIGSCMPNLELRLSKFIGSSDFPRNLFLKVLDLDGFSQYLISNLINSEDTEPEPAPVSYCAFAYNLYCTGRERMIWLMDDSFVDPRPFVEEGIENWWTGKTRSLSLLFSAHQVSLKAGHFTCFRLVMETLKFMLSSNTDDVLFALLCSAFDRCHLEDAEAWAAFYTGILKKRTGFLERSLSQARTPVLKSMAARELAFATHDFEKALDLLDICKESAIESGHEDLLLQAFYDSYKQLYGSRRFETLNNLSDQLSSLATEQFPTSSCLLALSKHVKLTFEIIFNGRQDPGTELLYKECSSSIVLPQPNKLTSSQTYHRYLSSGDDNWSTIKNEYMHWIASGTSLAMESSRTESNTQDSRLCLVHLRWLVDTDKLEEAETRTAEFLDLFAKGSLNDEVALAYVLVLLVELSRKYFMRDRHLHPDKIRVAQNLTRMINSFAEAALDIAKDHKNVPELVTDTLWYHAFGFKDLGRGLDSFEKMQQSLKLMLGEDINFGMFSKGRIHYMDKVARRFEFLQLLIADLITLRKFSVRQGADLSLVWLERHRARDFMFKLQNVKTISKDLSAFDSDEDKALEDVSTTMNILGDDTAVLVVTTCRRGDDSHMVIVHFLHLNDVKYSFVEVMDCHWELLTKIQETVDLTTEDWTEDVTFRNDFGLLHAILVKPFVTKLEEVQAKKLIFVPSKEFAKVPFSLLLDESRDEFLIQRYAISVISSLRLLKHCEWRRQELMKNATSHFSTLVVGDPTRDLQSASEEAYTVANFLHSESGRSSVTHLHNESATKQAVLQQLPLSDWIHVASHGIVNQEFPEGALLLASEKLSTRNLTLEQLEEHIVRTLRTSADSEKLCGEEIVQQFSNDMSKAWGAVLSTCLSGVGRAVSEGVLALPRSFHMCGVPSVVVSLWPVEDASTNKLMTIMYTNLLAGKDIAEALQAAMVEMLLEVDMWGYPVYHVRQWAPFVVSGSCSSKHPLSSTIVT